MAQTAQLSSERTGYFSRLLSDCKRLHLHRYIVWFKSTQKKATKASWLFRRTLSHRRLACIGLIADTHPDAFFRRLTGMVRTPRPSPDRIPRWLSALPLYHHPSVTRQVLGRSLAILGGLGRSWAMRLRQSPCDRPSTSQVFNAIRLQGWSLDFPSTQRAQTPQILAATHALIPAEQDSVHWSIQR